MNEDAAITLSENFGEKSMSRYAQREPEPMFVALLALRARRDQIDSLIAMIEAERIFQKACQPIQQTPGA